jgi:serine/threonine protein kinase
MSNLSPGSVISHYRIIELIARGGMGEVYKAVDTSLNRTVALKIPNETIVENSKAKRRFLHEAHAASRLSHPNICRIYEVGEEGEIPFFVMEYIKGPTLQKVVSSGPLTVERALRLAVQLADAIEEAHNIGIIHRDLKPSNIILNSRGAPVILDFGLAKRLRQNESQDDDTPTVMQSLTTGSMIVGTVSYMSPEQVRAASLDARSDIFSFGVLLYEMLVGRRPFNGAGQVEIMHAILHDEPPPPRNLRPEIDAELERIVGLALKKDVSQRYAAMADLKRDLYSLVRERGYDLSGASLSAPTTPPRTDLSTAQVSPQRTVQLSRRQLGGVAAAVLVLLLTGVLFVWWSKYSANEEGFSPIDPRQLHQWKSEFGDIGLARPRFSHDGRLIAFTKAENGHTDVRIKQIDRGEPVSVIGTQGTSRDLMPIFSPDNQEIAFVSKRGTQAGIWAVPLFGGDPRLLLRLEAPTARLIHWSQDAQTIYFSKKSNLYALDMKVSKERQLTNFSTAVLRDRNFAVSPDERRIAYFDVLDNQADIWVSQIDGSNPTRITNDQARDWNPHWHPDGKRIIYNSERGGIAQIFFVRLDRGVPRQLTFSDVGNNLADISSDGARILYENSRDESDLWSVQIGNRKNTPVTTDVGVEFAPDPSADGKKIVYQGSKVEAKIWSTDIISRDLGANARPSRLATNGYRPQWSRDGNRLAFVRHEGSQDNLWVMPHISGEPVLAGLGLLPSGYTMLPFNREHAHDYSWHPDNNQIVYPALLERRANLWTTTADGLHPRRLTHNEDASSLFFSPLWSPDGRQIAYLCRVDKRPIEKINKWSVQIYQPDLPQPQVVFEVEKQLRLLGWSRDGRELYISVAEIPNTSRTTSFDLYRLSTVGAPPQRITTLTTTYFFNTHLSEDGRWIAYVRRVENLDHIEVI